VPLTADGRGSAEEFIVVPTKRVASYFSELLDLKIFEPPVQREASPSIFLAASREARPRASVAAQSGASNLQRGH